MTFEVFSKPEGKCSWCEKTKDLLKSRKEEFTETELEGEELKKKWVEKKWPKPKNDKYTYPQIEKDGIYIGGYDDLENFFKVDKKAKKFCDNVAEHLDKASMTI